MTDARKTPASKITLPDNAAVEAARAKRAAHAAETDALPAGSVIGLPAGWVAAKLDPSLEDGRKAALRAKWAARGWLQLDGQHEVIGYPAGCEVWVKPAADFAAAREDRDRRIQTLAAQGLFILGST